MSDATHYDEMKADREARKAAQNAEARDTAMSEIEKLRATLREILSVTERQRTPTFNAISELIDLALQGPTINPVIIGLRYNPDRQKYEPTEPAPASAKGTQMDIDAIGALRKALEPFARLAGVLVDGDADDGTVIGVTVADLRRARAALAMQEPASETFMLDADNFDAFEQALGNPAPPNEKLRSLMQEPASETRCPACGDEGGCMNPLTCTQGSPASEPAPASAPSCCWEEAAKIAEGMVNKGAFTRDQYASAACAANIAAMIRARAQTCQCGELNARKIARNAVRAASAQVTFSYRPGQHVMTPDWFLEGCIADAISAALTGPRSEGGK